MKGLTAQVGQEGLPSLFIYRTFLPGWDWQLAERLERLQTKIKENNLSIFEFECMN